MSIQLFNDNVLTVPVDEKYSKEGGIYVATIKRNYKRLKVVEGLPEGSIVYVNINVGTDVDIEGKDYVVVNKRDIILRID